VAIGSISHQGDILVRLDDGTVINLADAIKEIQEDNLATKLLQNILTKLNTDTSYRLRVSAESVANMTTLTTCTNMGTGKIGLMGATALLQVESHMRFQQGFRHNLVVS
jgi:hypothetical protein